MYSLSGSRIRCTRCHRFPPPSTLRATRASQGEVRTERDGRGCRLRNADMKGSRWVRDSAAAPRVGTPGWRTQRPRTRRIRHRTADRSSSSAGSFRWSSIIFSRTAQSISMRSSPGGTGPSSGLGTAGCTPARAPSPCLVGPPSAGMARPGSYPRSSGRHTHQLPMSHNESANGPFRGDPRSTRSDGCPVPTHDAAWCAVSHVEAHAGGPRRRSRRSGCSAGTWWPPLSDG